MIDTYASVAFIGFLPNDNIAHISKCQHLSCKYFRAQNDFRKCHSMSDFICLLVGLLVFLFVC